VPRSETLLQHNLHEFQESVIAPIIDLPTSYAVLRDQALIDQRTALGLEAVWWAHLGSELEFFSIDDAKQLVRKQWAFIVHNFESFARRCAHHFDSQLPISSLPDLPEHSTNFVDPCCLHSAFQELLIKMSISNADPILRSFSATINFTSQAEWDELMKEGIESSARPQAAGRGRTSLSVVGLARALEFMTTVRRAAELTLDSREIDEPDAYAFVRGVARIVRWRFSAHLPSIYERFVQVADRVFDMTQHALNLPSLPGGTKSTYLRRVGGMLQEWQSWGSTAGSLSP